MSRKLSETCDSVWTVVNLCQFIVFSRSDKSDSVSQLRRPTIVKRDIKVDPEVEQKSLNEILGDFDEDCDDVPMLSDYCTPVALDEIKKELPTVKAENDNKHSALAYPEDLGEFFGRTQPQLFILQVISFNVLRGRVD